MKATPFTCQRTANSSLDINRHGLAHDLRTDYAALKPISSIWTVDDLVSQAATPPRRTQSTCRASNRLSGRLLECPSRNHIDLVWKRQDDILITAKLEVVGFDFCSISLDSIGIFIACKHFFHAPSDDERTG